MASFPKRLPPRGGRTVASYTALTLLATTAGICLTYLYWEDLLSTATDTGQAAPSEGRNRWLLLATHGRLIKHYVDTAESIVLHEGQGVYHGIIPGDCPDQTQSCVWVLSRPHNWRPVDATEKLILVNTANADAVSQSRLTSRFGHDVVRAGSRAFIASTQEGSIIELQLPAMDLTKTHQLFTTNNHVNSLAPLTNGSIWCLLHNRGESDIVLVDLEHDREESRLRSVGTHAHGLVVWRDRLVVLDSEDSALVAVHPSSGSREIIWRVPDVKKFLKGLLIIDDVAYFGIAPHAERQARAEPTMDCELAAVHLKTRRLLFRQKVETQGLLNTIAAPHLSYSSTYRATSWSFHSEGRHIGGRWDSGLPYLQGHLKAHWAPMGESANPLQGVQLLLDHVDVAPLKEAIQDIGEQLWSPGWQAVHNAHLRGRMHNTQRYKPGSQELLLLFSDRDGERVYQFPLYEELRDVLEPILLQIFGREDVKKLMRIHLAQLLPGSIIKIHRDHGGYTAKGHRIHVPIAVDSSTVAFVSCPSAEPHAISGRVSAHEAMQQGCTPLRLEQGLAYEINNAVPHLVQNTGQLSRLHLIIDAAEHVKPERILLRPGQQCAYKGRRIQC